MNGVSRIDYQEDVALVSFGGLPAGIALTAEIFSAFSDAGIVIDMISQTAPVGDRTSVSFTCSGSDMVKVLEISKRLSESYPALKPMVSSGNCKIQLYGEEMREAHGVFASVLNAISGTEVELRQITTSEVDISLLVSGAHLDTALPLLKQRFGIL